MKYQILQLKDVKTSNYAFMSYDFAIKHNFSLNDYTMIYEGEIDSGRYIENTLDNVFTQFNINKPQDFKGHSLSVSDIIVLGAEYWYVDIFGFKRLERNDLLQ